MGRAQSSLSELLSRVEKKADDSTVALWDDSIYETQPGRGRNALLNQDQKNRIITLVTSSRENSEKESWQAIADGDFNEIIPLMSITTLENVVYEAGYARRRPGWRPHLTLDQEQERYEWALAHNPDRGEEYDNKGFNFRKVVFSDETPARIGEERGMMRTWIQGDERWDDDVKHDRTRKECCLQ